MYRLNPGDKAGIISLARDKREIGEDFWQTKKELEKKYNITFELGNNFGLGVQGIDPKKRVEDLNNFISNDDIKLILAYGGGYHTNEVLPYIDFETLKNKQKTFCGFSDNTALNNAFWAKSDKITFSGPNFRTFDKTGDINEETIEYFEDIFIRGERKISLVSRQYYYDRSEGAAREIEDGGIKILKHGIARGKLVGGNISTLMLLAGTEYMPNLEGTILFLEEDFESGANMIRRMLFHLKQQKGFDKINGVAFGRFQRGSKRNQDLNLNQTILDIFGDMDIPIIKNCLFGHVSPMQTIPVGGEISINTQENIYNIEF